jgi:hypothetical protein
MWVMQLAATTRLYDTFMGVICSVEFGLTAQDG